MEDGITEVPAEVFTEKLTAYWRDKALSEADWKAWAGSVEVSWVPTL